MKKKKNILCNRKWLELGTDNVPLCTFSIFCSFRIAFSLRKAKNNERHKKIQARHTISLCCIAILFGSGWRIHIREWAFLESLREFCTVNNKETHKHILLQGILLSELDARSFSWNIYFCCESRRFVQSLFTASFGALFHESVCSWRVKKC